CRAAPWLGKCCHPIPCGGTIENPGYSSRLSGGERETPLSGGPAQPMTKIQKTKNASATAVQQRSELSILPHHPPIRGQARLMPSSRGKRPLIFKGFSVIQGFEMA